MSRILDERDIDDFVREGEEIRETVENAIFTDIVYANVLRYMPNRTTEVEIYIGELGDSDTIAYPIGVIGYDFGQVGLTINKIVTFAKEGKIVMNVHNNTAYEITFDETSPPIVQLLYVKGLLLNTDNII